MKLEAGETITLGNTQIGVLLTVSFGRDSEFFNCIPRSSKNAPTFMR